MEPAWNTPPPASLLPENEVHVWRAGLDLPNRNVQELGEDLSSDERERAGRYHFEKDRKYLIVRRGILRRILGFYLNLKPSRIQFRYGENGKPALADTFGIGAIHFNLSHSNGVALFAFARDREIGVDIEYMRDIPEMDKIVEQFFSKRERDVFRKLPKSQKREAFFNGWTCKEAFIKTLGDGLSRSLDKFDVSLAPGEPANLLRIEDDLTEASRWSIQGLKPAPHYVGAFAVKSHMFETREWQWEVAGIGGMAGIGTFHFDRECQERAIKGSSLSPKDAVGKS